MLPGDLWDLFDQQLTEEYPMPGTEIFVLLPVSLGSSVVLSSRGPSLFSVIRSNDLDRTFSLNFRSQALTQISLQSSVRPDEVGKLIYTLCFPLKETCTVSMGTMLGWGC